MIIVLIAVSFVTYLIFFKIPGGDPAQRTPGGRRRRRTSPRSGTSPGSTRTFRAVVGHDEAAAQRAAHLVLRRTNVVQQIKEGMPATFSLCMAPRSSGWLRVLVGALSAVRAGRFSDKAITALALVGISLPVAWLGLSSAFPPASRRGGRCSRTAVMSH
jgi:peptide/nickel transport system permease protein